MSKTFTKRATITTDTDKAEKSQTTGYIIYFVFGIIEILLIFRFILKLTGANAISNFVNTIYSITQILISPFVGIFLKATSQGAEATAIFEPATVIAIIIYAVVAWGIIQLVLIISGDKQ